MTDSKKCKRCEQSFNKDDILGINIFDAVTGMHIITRWYCRFCAKVLGLIPADNERIRQ